MFVKYYSCEMYYKAIMVQYYIADSVIITLLDLRPNWTHKPTLGMELVCTQVT